MNFTSYVTIPDYGLELSSVPNILWQYYLEYLWYYEPRSWVARIASMFRILAVMVAAPIVILMLLDIASYVIARTLGVVEDAKASTTDKTTPHKPDPPAILVESCTPPTDSDLPSMPNSRSSTTDIHDTHNTENTPAAESNGKHPEAYFASEEHGLKLSGVGVFSPAASQPSSPTLSRRQLHPEGNTLDDSAPLRRRVVKTVEGIPE